MGAGHGRYKEIHTFTEQSIHVHCRVALRPPLPSPMITSYVISYGVGNIAVLGRLQHNTDYILPANELMYRPI